MPKFNKINQKNSDEFGDDADQPTHDRKPSFEGPHKIALTEKANVHRSVPVEFFGEIVYVLLKDYQGKHYSTDADKNSFFFPYARYLKEGVEIKNTTTGEIYTVEEMIMNNSNRNMDGHHVRLRCEGSTPALSDKLRLSESNGQLVNLTESYPDSEVRGYEIGEDGHLTLSASPWTDTITYQVMETGPGKTTGGGGSSTGVRSITPQFREEILGVEGSHSSRVVTSQLLFNDVRFDCWSRSNNGSTSLRHWFRTFMHHYAWVFGYNGFTKMHMTGLTIPPRATKWRSDIVAKSASYFFTSQDNWVEELGHIRDISFEVKIPERATEENKEENLKLHKETVNLTGR